MTDPADMPVAEFLDELREEADDFADVVGYPRAATLLRQSAALIEAQAREVEAMAAALMPFADRYWDRIEESEVAREVGCLLPCDDDVPVVVPFGLLRIADEVHHRARSIQGGGDD